MGHQIIKRPDGTYAIWSSIVDDFILDQATKLAVIEFETTNATIELRDRLENVFNKLDKGEKSPLGMTYDDCLEAIAIRKELINGHN